MGTAIKHPVPDRVKPSFVIFVIWALWRTLDDKNYKWRLNPVWHSPYDNSGHQMVNLYLVDGAAAAVDGPRIFVMNNAVMSDGGMVW